jgi:hypothetical protein
MIEFVPAGNEPLTGEREKTKIRNGMSVAAAKKTLKQILDEKQTMVKICILPYLTE